MWTIGLNYKSPLVFAAVILPILNNIRPSKKILAHIECWMDLWYKSRFAVLVDNTVNVRVRGKSSTRPGCLHGFIIVLGNAGLYLHPPLCKNHTGDV